jgi:hypothetical protein
MVLMVALSEHKVYAGRVRDGTALLKVILANCISSAGALYGVWLWFKGLHESFAPTPCASDPDGNGTTYGLVFAKVSLYSPAVYKVLGALSAIVAAWAVLSTFYSIYVLGNALYQIRTYGRVIRWSKWTDPEDVANVERLMRQAVLQRTYPNVYKDDDREELTGWYMTCR